MRSVSPKILQINHGKLITANSSTMASNQHRLSQYMLQKGSELDRSIQQGRDNSFEQESSFHQLEVSYEAGRAFVGQSRALLAEIQESQQNISKQELEDRIVLLVTENERLQRFVGERENELQKQREYSHTYKQNQEEKLRLLEQKTTKLIYENEKVVLLNESLSQQFENLQQDFEMLSKKHQIDTEQIQIHWRKHYEKLSQEQGDRYQSNLKINQEKSQYNIQEFETQIRILNKDMENIKNECQNKDNIIDDIKKKGQLMENEYQQKETRYEEKINQVQNQLRQLIEENQKSNNLVEAKVRELQLAQQQLEVFNKQINEGQFKEKTLERTIQQYQQSIQQYQIKIQNQSDDYNKLNQQQNDLQEQYQQIQVELQNQYRRTQEYHIYVQQFRQIDGQYRNLQVQYDELVQKEQNCQIQIQQEIERGKKSLNKIEYLQNGINQLQTIQKEQQNECESLKQKLATVQKESLIKLQQLQSKNESQIHENIQALILQNQEKLYSRDNEIMALNDRISLLLNQVKLLTRDGKRSKDISIEVQSELDHLKPINQALNIEIDRMRQQIKIKDEETERLRQQIVKLQTNYELQHEEDCENLTKIIHSKEQFKKESESLNNQIKQLEQQLTECNKNQNQTSQILHESHNQIKIMQQQYQVTQIEVMELRQLKDQINLIKISSKQELDLLKKQFEQAIKIKTEKEVLIERDKWQIYAATQNIEIKNFESKIDALVAEIDTYRKEINSLKKQLNDMLQSKEKYKSRALDLEQTVEEYRKQNEANHNLQNKIKKLQEEIQTLNEKLDTKEQQYKRTCLTMEDEINCLSRDNKRLIDQNQSNKLRRNTPPPQRNDENLLHHPIIKERTCQYGIKRNPSIDNSFDLERTNPHNRIILYHY